MSTNLTKREIVLEIYRKAGFPQKQIVDTVQQTLDIIQKALAEGRKAFYTTPLKALSNQKYGDLVRRHGRDAVAEVRQLLT